MVMVENRRIENLEGKLSTSKNMKFMKKNSTSKIFSQTYPLIVFRTSTKIYLKLVFSYQIEVKLRMVL